MNIIIILIYGLVIGSFLNVCIYRIPMDESLVYPSSHCTSCKNRIKWYDLIPVVSYIILKGKCRYCGEKISIKYPLVEILTGIIFVALYFKYGLSYKFIKYAVLSSLLIVIGIIDYYTMDVYFKTIAAGLIAGIFFTIYQWYVSGSILEYLFGAFIGGSIISIIVLITKGMGWGDAEICLMSGLFLGFKLTVVMVFLSFIFGGIIGLILVIFKIKSQKDYMPFGPFISFASIFTIFFGQEILKWYL